MRWVFYSLLILNLVYLVWSLVDAGAPAMDPVREVQSGPSAPEKLTLLREARESGELEVSRGQLTPRQRLCPVVGPWNERAGAESALKTLRSAGYRGRVHDVDVEKERLHWVYLPPFESREKALEMLRELQSRGVDSFVVSEGDDRNAISLGYFSSADSAEGLRLKMNNAGYPAEIRQTARKVTEYWVYLDSRSIGDDGDALRRFIAERPDLEADHSSCGPALEPASGSS